jgi:adenylate cyclase
MTPTTAFREIANACLNHLHQNHQGGSRSTDAEYIHQMRVASRRLFAALRLFKPVLPELLSEQLTPPLRTLMTTLGTARDLDVLIAEIVDPVVNTMPAEPRIAALKNVVAERSKAARQNVVQTLNAPDYGRLLLLIMTKLHQLTDSTLSLNSFANARLKHLQHKVVRLAQQARKDDPASLHQLRIGAKRLRYALEFFAPLLPTRQTVALIKQLTRLQNRLGQLNDLANAGALLMDCAGDEAHLREAVSLIGGWHGQRYAELQSGVPNALSKLHKLRVPKAA